ncbi:hypothetical protein ACE1CI_34350 [Aerosakkonemataceae cyanobacterium BLCC-F50]|uniref:Uncharacterized protein n=1 Tax=Floridaenema flaviceps BLCC-F50 TaxID=3153642 RepID=A0ABV4Y2S0_9CYAN
MEAQDIQTNLGGEEQLMESAFAQQEEQYPAAQNNQQVVKEALESNVVPVPPTLALQQEYNQAQLLQAQRTEAIAPIVHSFLYLEGKPTATGAIAVGKSNTAVWDRGKSELTLYDNGSIEAKIPKMRVRYEGGSYTPLSIASSLEEIQTHGIKPVEVEHFVSKVKPMVDARLNQLNLGKIEAKNQEIDR